MGGNLYKDMKKDGSPCVAGTDIMCVLPLWDLVWSFCIELTADSYHMTQRYRSAPDVF